MKPHTLIYLAKHKELREPACDEGHQVCLFAADRQPQALADALQLRHRQTRQLNKPQTTRTQPVSKDTRERGKRDMRDKTSPPLPLLTTLAEEEAEPHHNIPLHNTNVPVPTAPSRRSPPPTCSPRLPPQCPPRRLHRQLRRRHRPWRWFWPSSQQRRLRGPCCHQLLPRRVPRVSNE